MRHPTEGVLRRILDEPAGVADLDRRHVGGCPRCLGTVAAAREDAALVDAALVIDSSAEVDIAAAWRRLSTTLPGTAVGGAAPSGQRARSGSAARPPLVSILRRPVVAFLVVALVLTGAGTAAATNWLQIFGTERVAPVSFSTADLVALPDLSAYGDVAMTGDPDVHEVSGAAAAEAESGLDVPEVADLPRGVTGEPVYQVGAKAGATFTFSPERAARTADEAGEKLPPPPPGLEGSSVRLVAGPGVAQLWSSSAGAPALIVGRAVAPKAFSSSGVPFTELRDYLLSLPGMPDGVAAQLRTLSGDGSTFPLPVPADEVSTSSSQVNGVPATVLVTRDQTLAGVVWVDGGVVTAVAGSLDSDEVLAVARELR